MPNTYGDPKAAPTAALEEFSFVSDLPVALTAELDRRPIRFEELVQMDVNTVISLTRPAGENIDVFVGDVLLGSGEILVIDNSLAIRVAELRDKPALPPQTVEIFDEESAAA